jgi:hypothetical protein
MSPHELQMLSEMAIYNRCPAQWSAKNPKLAALEAQRRQGA